MGRFVKILPRKCEILGRRKARKRILTKDEREKGEGEKGERERGKNGREVKERRKRGEREERETKGTTADETWKLR